MREEKLIRVESESEIKVGVMIVLKDCGACGHDHRGIVTNLVSTPGNHNYDDGTSSPCKSRSWNQTGDCTDDLLNCACFCISDGRLFRVDTGLDEAKDKRQESLDRMELAHRQRENAR